MLHPLKGLIIDSPHIDNILCGKKRWEMRTTGTKQRGTIALIKKGSGQVVGTARLIDSRGPLSEAEMLSNVHQHLIQPDRLRTPGVEKWRHAWVLDDATYLPRPVPYRHPKGAVIWVNLEPDVIERVISGMPGASW